MPSPASSALALRLRTLSAAFVAVCPLVPTGAAIRVVPLLTLMIEPAPRARITRITACVARSAP